MCTHVCVCVCVVQAKSVRAELSVCTGEEKKKLVSKGHSDLCSIPKMCVIIQELGVPSFHTH